MRVLITGVSGFAGRWLAHELAKDSSIQLYGISRSRPAAGILSRRLRFFKVDLNDRVALGRLLRKIRPDRIHHLAGQASVSLSWKNPLKTNHDNVLGTRNLLEILRKIGCHPVFHLAGSAEVYGRQKRVRIRETDRPAPRNPYARTKLAQEKLLRAYFRATGSAVVITRAFNHIGPGQKDFFALSDFAGQIARIEKGRLAPVLRVGNTSAVRDFTDVRDVVRAYRMAAETAQGLCVYNVATGRAVTLGSLIRRLAKLSRTPLRVEQETQRVRAEDLPRLVGNPAKLQRETGWQPKILLDQTLRDTLNYWRG